MTTFQQTLVTAALLLSSFPACSHSASAARPPAEGGAPTATSPLDRLEARDIPRELLPKDAPPELVAVLHGHTRTIGALAFLPDGRTLVSAEVGGPKKGD